MFDVARAPARESPLGLHRVSTNLWPSNPALRREQDTVPHPCPRCGFAEQGNLTFRQAFRSFDLEKNDYGAPALPGCATSRFCAFHTIAS
jgi:hypothetical protein